jgi:hypothetical protein
MAQRPMLRGEVGARALGVRLVPREEAWASAGLASLGFREKNRNDQGSSKNVT